MTDLATPRIEVPIIRDPTTALAVATRLAELASEGAAERDRNRSAPTAVLREISRSGLLGIAVPREYDGPELPWSTVVEVTRRLAVADPSIAQLLLTHWVTQQAMREAAPSALARAIFADVLGGAQLGNAVSERGTVDAFAHATTATRREDGSWSVTGTKYYATGALGASWIVVAARDAAQPDGAPVLAFIRPTDRGVALHLDDWSGFGQRSTFSGRVVLTDVEVPGPLVMVPSADRGSVPSRVHVVDQAIHAAIDVGTAEAALVDAVAFVRTRARPRPEFGGQPVAAEQYVLYRFGQYRSWLSAAEALLAVGSRHLDESETGSPESAEESFYTIAQVKALVQEVGTKIASAVFELLGSSATDEADGFDRHWRNIRTHSLHDPARYRYVQVGDRIVNGTPLLG